VHGYRFARLLRESDRPIQHPRLGPNKVQVLDFSPIAQHAHRTMYEGETFISLDGTEATPVNAITSLDRIRFFRDIITSALPYVVTTTGESFHTEGVMIGDDSLIMSRVRITQTSKDWKADQGPLHAV
jgi:hypothetical protein